jgi:hypothetical protein
MRVPAMIAVGVLLLIGCSRDPHRFRVTEANKDTFMEQIKSMKGFTIEENRLLLAYMIRNSLGSTFGVAPTSMVGKTLSEIITDQRAFETDAKKREEEQARLAAEAKSKADARAAELRNSVSLTVFSKGFHESDPSSGDYQDRITIRCAYQNLSPKGIRAFTGTVRFTDLFGRPIYESGLTISDPIAPDAKGTWWGSIDFNQFMDEHRRLRDTALEDMKVEWIPVSIIFSDDTQMMGDTNQ